MMHEQKEPRAKSGSRRYYAIDYHNDGTADVYLRPDVSVYHTDLVTEYDVRVLVVRGVEAWDGMEDDIRARYDSWCESAEVIGMRLEQEISQ